MHADGYFDEHVAGTYDDPTDAANHASTIAPIVDLLAELAGNGPALEFAIGTGRIALPLTQRGVEVHGIDRSQAMVDRLRAKPGGATIPVTIGDIATTQVDGAGSFTLVYLVFNTIMNLTTQAAQVACFRNAGAHLSPGGRFVIEVGIPDLRRLPPGDVHRAPYDVSPTTWSIDEYDVAHQGLISHHMEVVDGRLDRVSIPFRYVWPAELDLMAEVAGLRPRDRWATWTRTPFTSDSEAHVSVWERPR
ncbi:MAG TPA: class I SAM-dependent methyltransferase [Candidatus Limnocylindrales bacterium]